MIKLCSIQPVAERGGSDQALLRMLRSLPRPEFECHVVVPADPLLRPELEAADVQIHVVPMRRISRSHRLGDWVGYALAWPVTVVRLAHLLRRLDVDVVHTNSFHSWYGWAAALLARRPHVWHGREIVVQSRAALTVERFLIPRCSARVLSMSHAIADQLDGVDVVVVHETPDPAEFGPVRAGRFRARVAIDDDALLVGAAGRIDSWKGVDVLLDAFGRVRASRSDVQLVVAGGSVRGKEDLFAALAATARATPGVHWLGSRDDIPDLLADLDLFVLASTEPEPYGLVLVEALMSGAPVVATDAGGPREIVAEATPGSGRLVPVHDAGAMAAAILATLDELAPTSAALRAARPPLRAAEPERFAAIFRGVVAQPTRGTRKSLE
jgi:glycosyltransferase involved in cell wall biosynthesis